MLFEGLLGVVGLVEEEPSRVVHRLVGQKLATAGFLLADHSVLGKHAGDRLRGAWYGAVDGEDSDHRRYILSMKHVAVQRMVHVGIVVEDLVGAIEFFVELGLERLGAEVPVEGRWVDEIVGLEGVRADIAFVQTPDGRGQIELTRFHTPTYEGDNRPAPSNAPGFRHLSFAVEDIDAVVARLRARGAELVGEVGRFEDSYRLCYVRGPAGIIVELAQKIG